MPQVWFVRRGYAVRIIPAINASMLCIRLRWFPAPFFIIIYVYMIGIMPIRREIPAARFGKAD